MTDEDTRDAKRVYVTNNVTRGAQAGGGAVYGLGLIGAALYYIQHAATFGEGVIGIFKAILWPAFVIYQVLTTLKM